MTLHIYKTMVLNTFEVETRFCVMLVTWVTLRTVVAWGAGGLCLWDYWEDTILNNMAFVSAIFVCVPSNNPISVRATPSYHHFLK